MNNWQEWVVGMLIVLCLCRMVHGAFIFFCRAKENKNPCDTCVSSCELKGMIGKKCEGDKVKKKSTKKKYCG